MPISTTTARAATTTAVTTPRTYSEDFIPQAIVDVVGLDDLDFTQPMNSFYMVTLGL
jgi:hypothetical protein